MPAKEEFYNAIDSRLMSGLHNKLKNVLDSTYRFYEFSKFSQRVTPVLTGIVNSTKEAEIAADVILEYVGKIELAPDDGMTDHHGRSVALIGIFEANEAYDLIRDKLRLERLIKAKLQ